MAVFVIYDLEYTSWPGAQDRGWTGPGEFREIVQIGALRVDPENLQVVADYDALVTPVRNPVLSDFFVDLTGITQAELDDRGQDFPAALNGFATFCDGGFACSYGNDMVIIGENVILQFPPGQAPAMPLPPFVNIRPHLNRLIPTTTALSAGRLREGLGITLPSPREPLHNAVLDCYAILDALIHLRRRGLPLFEL
jgi:inhibitor of KinA sporulation pathway (predicted exonuclease)